MTLETFVGKKFHPASLDKIDTANGIIREYQKQGYTLTLRQLYYQFVSRGIIENTDRSYKSLGNIVTDGRLAGLISWDGIEDRGRSVRGWLIEEDLDNILSELPYACAVDMWANQDTYVEVWVEKDALSSVVQRACSPRRVRYMACKGYLSASEAYRSGKRFEAAIAEGKRPLVIHLGDHDPSGIDMTRDNKDRVSLFSYEDIEVRRIALNYDQVLQYNPPPNPTKLTDSRADDYIANHGHTSWELDALEPSVIVSLIQTEIEDLIDELQWLDDLDRERDMKNKLRKVQGCWSEIETLLED